MNHSSNAEWLDWHWQTSHSASGLLGLREVLGLSSSEADRFRAVVERYPFRVTPYYLSLADLSRPDDPVRRQCIPDVREMADEDCIEVDPFKEQELMPVPGLIHRYRDRVLVIVTNNCAVRCRHCTRKNTLSGTPGDFSRSYFDAMHAYIAATGSIREVILSGGDPLLVDPSLLNRLLGSMRTIRHVEAIRIGTRVPVVLPMRIDAELCRMLASHRPLWVNTQFNHPVEITPEAVAACELMLTHGIPVSNQAVLLRGVNDSLETMRALCNRLQRNMIRPYYVFQCDPVRGIAHFRTAPGAGADLAEALRNAVGGLSMPGFVADIPGEAGKVPLN